MGQRGRPKAPLVLTDEERATLARWARRPNTPQCLALRSESCWPAPRGTSNQAVAAELACIPGDGGEVAVAVRGKRLDGLVMSHVRGRRARSRDDHVEAVMVKTLNEQPADATHWSTRPMATATGMSQPTISRIWKAFGLKPWLDDDVQVVHRPAVRREGARHRRPVPEPAGTGRGPLRRREDPGAGPGPHPAGAAAAARHPRAAHPRLRPARHHRTCTPRSNLTTGLVIHQTHRPAPRRGVHAVPQARSTGPSPPTSTSTSCWTTPPPTRPLPIHRWLLRHPRFHLHFTPTYSSWMNLVERWFAELTTKWLRRGTHRSVKELAAVDHALGSTRGTTTPAPSSGTRPPTRSSTPSPHIASESPNRDTRNASG